MHKPYYWMLAGAVALSVGTLKPAAAAPPEGWTAQDIGAPDPAGSTDVDANGVWTMQGAGNDIWSAADNFHYAFQRVTGDTTVTAQYLSMEPGEPTWRRPAR